MNQPAVLILAATPDYRTYDARCPCCRGEWVAKLEDLYNVNAMPCIWCGAMLAVSEPDFHGDANVRADEGG